MAAAGLEAWLPSRVPVWRGSGNVPCGLRCSVDNKIGKTDIIPVQNEIPEIRMETQQTIFGPVPAQYSLGSVSFPVCPVNTETMLVKTGYGSRRNGVFPARFHPYVLMLQFRGGVRRGRR